MTNLTARFLTNDDATHYDAFLEPHTASSYFLRSNPYVGGLVYGGESYQAEYIGVFDGKKLVAVVAYSWINTILGHAENPEHLAAAIPLLKGCIIARGGKIEAICAMKPVADFIMAGLNIPQTATRKDEHEYLFSGEINNMDQKYVAHPTLKIRAATTHDSATLIDWRTDFNINFLNATAGDDLIKSVTAEIERRTKMGELFVVEDIKSGALLSFAGISSLIPEHAHIGPVYTPPSERGKGYARYCLVGGFENLKNTTRPTLKTTGLFAESPSAIKSYESIGYEKRGDFRLALIREDFRYG